MNPTYEAYKTTSINLCRDPLTHGKYKEVFDTISQIKKDLNEIEKIACNVFNIDQELFFTKNKTKEVSGARHVVCFYMRRTKSLSYVTKRMGFNSNKSVVLACDKCKDAYIYNKSFDNKLQKFLKLVKEYEGRGNS